MSTSSSLQNSQSFSEDSSLSRSGFLMIISDGLAQTKQSTGQSYDSNQCGW